MSGLDEKIKTEELATLFPDGVPMVAMKIIFPESSHPLTIAEVRCVLSALAASATPAYVGEEPVAWVNERAIDDIAKGNEQDGFAGVQTVLWADENTAGKRHSKRVPLYSAAALERVTRERDEANELKAHARKRCDDAEAKLAEARKVIERFARLADNYTNRSPSDAVFANGSVFVSDIRAARRFLEETK